MSADMPRCTVLDAVTRAVLAAATLVAVLGGVVGCASPPPLLSPEQVESGEMPPEHPKLTADQVGDCESCHKVE